MSQVSWPHLFPISLRLNLALAVLAQGRSLEALAEDKQASLVLKTALDYTLSESEVASGEEFRTPQPSEAADAAPLDVYFAAVGEQLRKRDKVQASVSAKTMLAALVERCSPNICEKCCTGPSMPHKSCEWTEQSEATDAVAMETRADCLRPVNEIFALCRDVACREYTSVLGRPPSQTVSFSTGHTPDRDSMLGLGLHALTDEPTRGLLTDREVHLSFAVSEFDVQDYLGTLYVLFHECFVHAYCGVSVKTGATESKAFHEGWMDSVGTMVLNAALEVSLVASPQHPVAAYASEFLTSTKSLREARYNPRGRNSPHDSIQWRVGARALETFRRLLTLTLQESQPGMAPTALATTITTRVIRFSVALNASDVSHERRGEFTSRLVTHYDRNSSDDRAAALAMRPQITTYLEAYLASDDLPRLVKSVLAIR